LADPPGLLAIAHNASPLAKPEVAAQDGDFFSLHAKESLVIHLLGITASPLSYAISMKPADGIQLKLHCTFIGLIVFDPE
jgi:hypothetical protein